MYKQLVNNLSTHTTPAHAFYAALAQGFPSSLGTKLVNACFSTHANRPKQDRSKPTISALLRRNSRCCAQSRWSLVHSCRRLTKLCWLGWRWKRVRWLLTTYV